MRNRLVIPPYVGEFGWELMNWQGRVRRIVREGRFAECALCVRPGLRLIYDDFLENDRPAMRCVEVSVDRVPGEPSEDHRVDASGARVDAEVLQASMLEAMRTTGVDI